MSTKNKQPSATASLVGSAFGQLAKRVGALVNEVSQVVSVPEEVRKSLEEARKQRHRGNFNEALAVLDQLGDAHRSDANRLGARWLTQVCGRWWGDLESAKKDASRSDASETDAPEALKNLGRCEEAARAGDWESVLENGRRMLRHPPKLPSAESQEVALVAHYLLATAYGQLGRFDRALHSFNEILSLTQEIHLPLLWPKVGILAASWSLAAGAPEKAEIWLAHADSRLVAASAAGIALPPKLGADWMAEQALMRVRVALALGQEQRATLEADAMPDGLGRVEAQVRCALYGGRVDALARERALELVKHPDRVPSGRRLWMLCEVQAALLGRAFVAPLAVLEAFEEASMRAHGFARAAWEHERAFAALLFDRIASYQPVSRPGETRYDASQDCVERELIARLSGLDFASPDARADSKSPSPLIAAEDASDQELERLRARLQNEAVLDLPLGVDELSPLRQSAWRRAVVLAHVHRQRAEIAARRGELGLALDEHAQALAYLPGFEASLKAIDDAFARTVGQAAGDSSRADAWMHEAVRILERLEATKDGAKNAAVRESLRQARAEFERPHRALAIAVVGEFSAGKSSLVNGILGESLSPVGVLPTTKTILRFRQGNNATRVVDTSGQVRMMQAAETSAYLHSLTPDEAREVATIECFGQWRGLGNVVLIDTPGLNAGDAADEESTRELVEEIDALIWVFSATRAGAASEVAAISQWQRAGHAVIAVLNKADALESGEVEELTKYLARSCPGVTVVPMSATGKREVPGRSGDSLVALMAAIESELVAKKAQIQAKVASRRVRAICERELEAHSRVVRANEQRERRPRDRVFGNAENRSDAAQALIQAIVGLDDVLMREVLSLRHAAASGPGAKPSRDDDGADSEALVDRLEHEIFAKLAGLAATDGQPTVREHGQHDRAAWHDFLIWARGAWAAMVEAGALAQTLRHALDGAAGGEQGIKLALRTVLQSWAEFWAIELRAAQRRHQIRARGDASLAPLDTVNDFWTERLKVLLASRGAEA
jgi:GTPase Era involved in 16S rRNA processing